MYVLNGHNLINLDACIYQQNHQCDIKVVDMSIISKNFLVVLVL